MREYFCWFVWNPEVSTGEIENPPEGHHSLWPDSGIKRLWSQTESLAVPSSPQKSVGCSVGHLSTLWVKLTQVLGVVTLNCSSKWPWLRRSRAQTVLSGDWSSPCTCVLPKLPSIASDPNLSPLKTDNASSSLSLLSTDLWDPFDAVVSLGKDMTLQNRHFKGEKSQPAD